jgi:hypothetical protein
MFSSLIIAIDIVYGQVKRAAAHLAAELAGYSK